MSDQLTAYQLAEPEAEQLALCVLVKTNQPAIEWQFASRSGEQIAEYLAKVGYVAREWTRYEVAFATSRPSSQSRSHACYPSAQFLSIDSGN